jgi:hypothetical protein
VTGEDVEPFVALVLALAGRMAVTAVALCGMLAFLRPGSCDRARDRPRPRHYGISRTRLTRW